jgi:HEAT repeat protein
MNRLALACLLAALSSGCNDGTEVPDWPAAEGTSGGSQPRRTDKADKPKPPEKVAAAFAADAYSDVPTAIAAWKQALAEKDNDTVRVTEAWLAMHKDRAIKPLAKIVADEEQDLGLRVAACRTLCRMGAAAKPIFLDGLNSSTQLVRLNCIKGLGAIQPSEPATVQTLLELTEHEDAQVRVIAVQSLGQIGSSAEAAVPRLLQILNSKEDETLRSAAKQSLKKINPRHTFLD